METPKIINNHSLFSPFKMIGICKFFIVPIGKEIFK